MLTLDITRAIARSRHRLARHGATGEPLGEVLALALVILGGLVSSTC